MLGTLIGAPASREPSVDAGTCTTWGLLSPAPSTVTPERNFPHVRLPQIGTAWVSDASALVPGTAYDPAAGAGTDTVQVQCTYDGVQHTHGRRCDEATRPHPRLLCSTLHAQTVDKKFVLLNGLQFGAAIGDVLTTRHCINAGTCREGNPLMPHSTTGQWAVTLAWGGASTAGSYR